MTIEHSKLSGVVPFGVFFEGEAGPTYQWECNNGDDRERGGYQAAYIFDKPGAYSVIATVDGVEQVFTVNVQSAEEFLRQFGDE